MKFVIIYLAIMVFAGISWVKNALNLVGCDFEPSYKAEIIYAIGVFSPTCVVSAWLDLGD